jgi:2,4-dienoyl-CoA reductase (NADPH2)
MVLLHPLILQSVNIDSFLTQWGVDNTNAVRGGIVDKPEWKSRRKVQLLQRKTSKHGAGLGKTTGWIHRAGLNNMNVDMIGGCTYEKVDEDGNLHVTITTKTKKGKGKGAKVEVTTEQRILVNDNIVVCAGQESLLELETPLQAAGISCYRIGGAQYVPLQVKLPTL